ncbi:uncharacterized protein M421DRAFT_417691 [Didymella exigua CBS 183.55]|uniref:Uncharacterized protein n=1 Tax=Didymella exigua CBS 183.55 TaxID=1150837 RepID=A0A6A5RVR1_9PLEO|nr:uncharacterized protein M421DRAFT_417691 [Didymella exigua CBS 183.55]KAF1931962.1 hypothetical protein M421DRAFT_417691 [Didymella exigua CBS 183.55]
MKSFTLITAVALAAGVSAQYSASSVSMESPGSMSAMPAVSSAPAASVTTTITAKAGCPTGPAADVMVTRSNAPVPSCEAGNNATKPSIVSMPGYGMGSGMGGASGGASGSGNATSTRTGAPAEFTGAAGKTAISGALAAVAGFAVYML